MLGLAPVEKAVAKAILNMSLRGTVFFESYVLSEVRGADILIIDVDMPQAIQALLAYRKIHFNDPTLIAIAIGNGGAPPQSEVQLPRPLLASALHETLSQIGAALLVDKEEATNTQAEFPDGRVLIADAQAKRVGDLRNALARVVGRIDLARCGQAAATHISTGALDVVVLDTGLEDPDAHSLCAAAKSHSNAAVIMLVDADASTDRNEAMKVGCDTYLIRPVNPLILQEVVAEYLNER